MTVTSFPFFFGSLEVCILRQIINVVYVIFQSTLCSAGKWQPTRCVFSIEIVLRDEFPKPVLQTWYSLQIYERLCAKTIYIGYLGKESTVEQNGSKSRHNLNNNIANSANTPQCHQSQSNFPIHPPAIQRDNNEQSDQSS